MGDGTGIAWTDATWNPTRGCSRVSPGCVHCYAETTARRFAGPGQPYEGTIDANGRWSGVIRTVPSVYDQPMRWRRPRRVFVNSMSDLFHSGLPREELDRIVGSMADLRARHHTFQVLTKRPALMHEYLSDPSIAERIRALVYGRPPAWPARDVRPVVPDVLPHVWWGVTVENQKAADDRIGVLRDTPAALRFLSVEPLLERVDLGDLTGIGWVIVGGESGPGARTCAIDWIRSVVGQCRRAGVPVFVKQLGSRSRGWGPVLVDRKGGDPAEWPEDLRVQEFPPEVTRG